MEYLPIQQMTEIQELFFELFMGSVGGWLGFIIVASVMMLVTVRIKYAGIPFMVVSIFMGILLLNNLQVNANLLWCAVMYFLMPILLLIIMIKT